jgi:lambda family phage portal protein
VGVWRPRPRERARDNAHAKKFLQMVETNVIGPDGVILQNKAGDWKADGTFALDKIANNIIEREWAAWGRRGCEVTGRLSWPALQRLYVRTMARDGEVLLRRIRDGSRNRHGYTLQFIDVDRLDERYNDTAKNGNLIRMGIELNREGRAVAYWINNYHPGDIMLGHSAVSMQRERVPADDIIHDFIQDRPEQIRGVPWMHAAMIRLNHLGAFDEAAIIAARIGAAKMGFWTSKDGDASALADDEDASGNLITEAEPGTFGMAPDGYEFQSFDPKYPEANYDAFVKACLRGIASGFGVSYNSLASDLEGVSYSSIRQGVLDERDCWKTIQTIVVDGLCQPVFLDWLKTSLLLGQLGSLPSSKLQKFHADTWQPRRWQWVDPKNDIEAAKLAVELNVTSRSRIAAEAGVDFDDIALENEQDMKLLESLGLSAPAALEAIGDG